MPTMQPLNVRLPREQLAWLDGLRKGPIVTRSEALRHIVDEAMKRDARRRPALASKVRQVARSDA